VVGTPWVFEARFEGKQELLSNSAPLQPPPACKVPQIALLDITVRGNLPSMDRQTLVQVWMVLVQSWNLTLAFDVRYPLHLHCGLYMTDHSTMRIRQFGTVLLSTTKYPVSVDCKGSPQLHMHREYHSKVIVSSTHPGFGTASLSSSKIQRNRTQHHPLHRLISYTFDVFAGLYVSDIFEHASHLRRPHTWHLNRTVPFGIFQADQTVLQLLGGQVWIILESLKAFNAKAAKNETDHVG
jgi:hypothetical protein